MEDDHSLLAHLVLKLTSQVEDAATDALAYILNQSESCREALASLVSDGEHQLRPLHRASTQVTVPPDWRLDLVAYDADDSMRLIIESKFWAALLSCQASGYVTHLAADGPATLLFVAPEVRRETLWVKIRAQFDKAPSLNLESDRTVGQLRVADVTKLVDVADDAQGTDARWIDTESRVALTSWYALLNHLEPVDSSMTSNIRQLRSLANAADDKAFAPLHAEDFNPAIPRRHMDFCRLVDDLVNTGEQEGWISVKGFKATAQRDGYLRFFRFVADDGGRMSKEIALYLSASRWVKSGTTPTWLRLLHAPEQKALTQQTEIAHEKDPGGPTWVPLRLLTDVEYSDVFDDVVAQVRAVRDIVLR
ncbi:hypothetical protein [Candidatus Poriferisodalis sp.]|uniref:hypothetical protein n=1 Tax=Candidatus Poriferisodalis sp. TaxID=3101277 RepID=UPI003B0238C0